MQIRIKIPLKNIKSRNSIYFQIDQINEGTYISYVNEQGDDDLFFAKPYKEIKYNAKSFYVSIHPYDVLQFIKTLEFESDLPEFEVRQIKKILNNELRLIAHQYPQHQSFCAENIQEINHNA